jgi:hypothetical protein
MIRSDRLVPLIAAIISALALLGGYMYQKNQEREEDINRKRQDIYSRLIDNLISRNEIYGRILNSPAGKKAQNDWQKLGHMFDADAEGVKNKGDMKTIGALLILYGTDDAIRAYKTYLEKLNSGQGTIDDVGTLITDLRKTLYPKTKATVLDANKVIWDDPKYFKSSAAK